MEDIQLNDNIDLMSISDEEDGNVENSAPSSKNIDQQAEEIDDIEEIDINKKYKNARGEVVPGKQLEGLVKGFYNKAEETAALRKKTEQLENQISNLQMMISQQPRQQQQQQEEDIDLFAEPEQQQANDNTNQLFAKALADQYEKLDNLESQLAQARNEQIYKTFTSKFPGATRDDFKAWQQAKASNDPDQELLVLDRLTDLKKQQADQQEAARRQDLRQRQVAGRSKVNNNNPPPNESAPSPISAEDAIAAIKRRMQQRGW